ncbi:MAG TPA: efflux RND transporter periplasmic adaptor subunit [Thermoanaerobaculia bacterium]|jgi:HlyD family secretion protein
MRFVRSLGLAAVAVAAAGALGCPAKDDGRTLHLNGRIEAPLVDLAPKVAGRVIEVRVREGDRVKAGDLLVRLDLGGTALDVERDREGARAAQARYEDMAAGSRRPEIAGAEADVRDKTAAVALARKDLERQDMLLEKKVGTVRDHDRAKTDLERAEAALKASEERQHLAVEGSRRNQTDQARFDADRAKVQLQQSETTAKEAEIRAPADAVVLHRMAEPGLLLTPSQPAVTLAFADRLYVRSYIPEAQLGRIRTGQTATVTVDAYPGRTFAAKVAEISPDAEFTPKPVETKSERVNLVYSTKIDLDAGWKDPLVPGQPADVVVDTQSGPK